MGPRTERDYQVFPHIEELDGRVSGEQILCGRGLVSLYRAVCKADGATAKYSEPQEVTAAAFGGSDRQATETLDLFATYLGRLAGDLALVFMATTFPEKRRWLYLLTLGLLLLWAIPFPILIQIPQFGAHEDGIMVLIGLYNLFILAAHARGKSSQPLSSSPV